nr:ATP-binding protein [Geodermatophilaceae bacterium]
QERELRSWLYGRAPEAASRFAAALEGMAADVEDSYAVAVEAVLVGDCDVDPAVAALVQAAREAVVNAARHSGVDTVSLYGEVEPQRVVVYVRDRGVGFDPADVPADRQGIRGSIHGRMARFAGHARLRSAPGAGTEVELSVDRADVAAVRG